MHNSAIWQNLEIKAKTDHRYNYLRTLITLYDNVKRFQNVFTCISLEPFCFCKKCLKSLMIFCFGYQLIMSFSGNMETRKSVYSPYFADWLVKKKPVAFLMFCIREGQEKKLEITVIQKRNMELWCSI